MGGEWREGGATGCSCQGVPRGLGRIRAALMEPWLCLHPGWGFALSDCPAHRNHLLMLRSSLSSLGHSAWTLPLLSPAFCTPCLSLDPFRPAPGSPLGCFCPSQGLPPAHANIWSIVYTASHPRCFAKAQPGPEMRGPVRNTALLETCKTAQTSLE